MTQNRLRSTQSHGFSAQFEASSGMKLRIRRAKASDAVIFLDFLRAATPRDLRYRFLSAIGKVSGSLARDLVSVDHRTTENFLAFDEADGRLAASAMIATDRPGSTDAEVAVIVRSDLQGRGIGWKMFEQAANYAKARGIKRIHSIELADNRPAIELEEQQGFIAKPCPDDMTLTILTKELS